MTNLYLGERSQEYYVRGHSKNPGEGSQSPMTIHNELLDELLAGQDLIVGHAPGTACAAS
jgi:hypothetical protein